MSERLARISHVGPVSGTVIGYTVAKGEIHAWTKTVSVEVATLTSYPLARIAINEVALGPVDTHSHGRGLCLRHSEYRFNQEENTGNKKGRDKM